MTQGNGSVLIKKQKKDGGVMWLEEMRDKWKLGYVEKRKENV